MTWEQEIFFAMKRENLNFEQIKAQNLYFSNFVKFKSPPTSMKYSINFRDKKKCKLFDWNEKKNIRRKICTFIIQLCFIEANLAYHDMFISPPYNKYFLCICLFLSSRWVILFIHIHIVYVTGNMKRIFLLPHSSRKEQKPLLVENALAFKSHTNTHTLTHILARCS